MKTADQIKAVIAKLTDDLQAISNQIESIQQWQWAGSAMQDKEFFVAQAKTLDELRKQQWQAEYRIRAYKWVLEEK